MTKDSVFLDEIPPFLVYLEVPNVPLGKLDAPQVRPPEVSKTNAIAKVRILVEQIKRRIKTLKILANELPKSMLENVNDIMLLCAALCSFKKPMYHDYI